MPCRVPTGAAAGDYVLYSTQLYHNTRRKICTCTPAGPIDRLKLKITVPAVSVHSPFCGGECQPHLTFGPTHCLSAALNVSLGMHVKNTGFRVWSHMRSGTQTLCQQPGAWHETSTSSTLPPCTSTCTSGAQRCCHILHFPSVSTPSSISTSLSISRSSSDPEYSGVASV